MIYFENDIFNGKQIYQQPNQKKLHSIFCVKFINEIYRILLTQFAKVQKSNSLYCIDRDNPRFKVYYNLKGHKSKIQI